MSLDSLFHLRTPYMSLCRSPCDSLVIKDDKSSVKLADFNDSSMCVYAAILNRLQSVTSSHTCFCQFEKTHEHGARDQPTVTFPIGDHVNVLYDYKKTGPSKILKLLTCHCHHLIDMLLEFCQNHIFLTLIKWLNVPYPSMLINFCMNYYAFVPFGEKILPPIKII